MTRSSMARSETPAHRRKPSAPATPAPTDTLKHGSYPARGLAKLADRSIKRMMQPRDEMPDGDCWESPVEGETRQGRATRQPSSP
jgi:hypothetical protein